MLGKLLRLIIPARWRPITYLENHAYRHSGGRVHSGMFKGMRYIPHAYFSAYIPKLLGTYERELTAAIDAAVAAKPELVVDVGAAEGYYAVGLALRLPGTKVVAFEMAPKAQELLRKMVEMNGVQGQVEIRGRCDRPDLQELITRHPRALVI